MAATVVNSLVTAVSATLDSPGASVAHGFTLADDDYLVAFVGHGDDDGGNPWTCASGGTWSNDAQVSTSTDSDRTLAALKIRVDNAASFPATITFTNARGDAENVGIALFQCRGVDTTTPLDATPTTSIGSDDFTPTAPAITTATDSALLLTAHLASSGNLSGNEGGVPSGMTGADSPPWAFEGTNQFDILIEAAYKIGGTAGSQVLGDWTGTPDDGSSEFACITVALRPAASGANEMSGTPTAQPADATGTMEAVASASGAPTAETAASAGTLQHRSDVSGAPQAAAASASGTIGQEASMAGASQAATATATGSVQALASAAGAPTSAPATSQGALGVVASMSGTPQAETATTVGVMDDGTSVPGTLQLLWEWWV